MRKALSDTTTYKFQIGVLTLRWIVELAVQIKLFSSSRGVMLARPQVTKKNALRTEWGQSIKMFVCILTYISTSTSLFLKRR